MGCPQSKKKNKDISNGGNGVAENGATRRKDAVSPDDVAKKPHQITKHPHEYNDDPMVRGRADVYEPSLDNFDVDDEKEEQKTMDKDQTEKEIVQEIDQTQKDNAEEIDNESIQPFKADTVETVQHTAQKGSFSDPDDTTISDALQTEKESFSNSEQINTVKDEGEDKTFETKVAKNMLSVFVVADTDSADENGEITDSQLDNQLDKPVDTNQVDVGNVVNEILFRQQITNEEGVFIPQDDNNTADLKPDLSDTPNELTEAGEVSETARKMSESETGQQTSSIETADGYTFTETTHTDFKGSPVIRHIRMGRLEYGLPEGVPKPAPPKSRKADIIKPGAFAMADKLVDQAPDNAFGSMQKLSSYLTGEGKKSDLEAQDDESTEGKNLAPIRPTHTRKKDIIKDIEMFRKIDENAKKTPESVKMSVEKLTKHLCSVASTDLEKVRAIYFWICNNIGYIYDKSNKSLDFLRYDAVSTLRQGQGSFVNLMAAMCKEAGVQVVTIAGSSKGLGHEPDKQFKFQETNHSWNAVYLNSEWRFIDCTWGSGFLDVQGKFRRQFDEFWFLTDPEVFAYDHLPTHEIWQLLEEPIDIDEFNSLPSLTEKSREYGLQLISHREPIIYFQNEVTVNFGTKEYPLSNITADLRDSEGREVNAHRCMQKIDNKTFSVRVIPPEVGQYALILYGKAKDYRHAKFMKLTEYILRCDQVYTDKVIFPDHLKAWGAEPNYADHGFAKSIEDLSVFKSESNEMTITLEQTRNVSLIPELKAVSDLKTELKDYTMITARENEKVIFVRFPSDGYYKLDIYAEREEEKYDFAASFLLECTVSESPNKLPKYNASSICKNSCELVEPLIQEIPSNTEVVFRIRSHGLRSAMVGIPMEKDYGSRLKSIGELVKKDDEFLAQIKTPDQGETIYLSGCANPPNVFWSRLYEFVTV